jgi:Macro domain
VNSIGSHLDLSRGALSGALLNHAGPDLQEDLYKEATRYPKARVYVTKGHGLPCRHVIHVICGGYSESKESNQVEYIYIRYVFFTFKGLQPSELLLKKARLR